MLMGAMERGRVATSYLFAGEQGVGKRLTAVNFVKALNCASPVMVPGRRDSCEECPSCMKINSLSHPDFMIVEPEGGIIKVEKVRDVAEALSWRSHEGGLKAVIVDDAECMNISASNAFLKTLEEPSPDSVIILVSSGPGLLPETIRSRCSRVNFRPLSTSGCMEVLKRRLKGRKAEGAGLLARLSMGRPGLAVREDLVKARGRFLDSLGGLLSGGEKPVWRDREDILRWFDIALLVLRDMAVLKIRGGDGLVNSDIEAELSAMASASSPERIMECYEGFLRVRGTLRFNLNKGITWNHAAGLWAGLSASA